MIFHPCENARFITNNVNVTFNWTGEFVGDITDYVNQLPAIKGKKLFVLYPSNQYIILESYNTTTHIIELIKRVYGMYSIPYNFCIYKKKQYIMYMYTPFVEIEYSALRKKKDEISEDERRIIFLHSILGVKGKTIKIVDPNDHNNCIITSNCKYSSIDYERNKLSSTCMDKFFGNYHQLYNTSLFFKDNSKIDYIRSLMSNENYWWFQEIEKRIEQLVQIT